MIGIKIVISICIVVICAYLGNYKANTYETRVRELKRIKNSLIFFRSKLEFTYEPIKEIFGQISKSIYLNKYNVFKETINNIDENDINISWNNSVEASNNFNSEDKDVLKMFGKLLGKTDKKGQISEVDLAIEFVNKQIEKAEIERSKNKKLYKSLGLILGIGIVIVLA